jgi:2'-deoxynucleoside 5'-phosphate N-hydrolase
LGGDSINIYFSCSITGGRGDQPVYQALVEAMLAWGHEIPTAHLSSTAVTQLETTIEADLVYQRDTDWVKGCDVVVAEVSTPSHGVGYEIALAVTLGKPVLCCYQAGKKVSKMLLGNPHVVLAPYETSNQAVEAVEKFLSTVAVQRM